LIIKEIIERETVAGKHYSEPARACPGCALGCQVAYAAAAPDDRIRRVAVHAGRLRRIAFVVFAGPLVLLVAVAAVLQNTGLAQRPLASLAVVLLSIGIYMALISFQGTRLLNSLQFRYL
jgi:hypothetical protein